MKTKRFATEVKTYKDANGKIIKYSEQKIHYNPIWGDGPEYLPTKYYISTENGFKEVWRDEYVNFWT